MCFDLNDQNLHMKFKIKGYITSIQILLTVKILLDRFAEFQNEHTKMGEISRRIPNL